MFERVYTRTFEKALKKLDKRDRQRIEKAVEQVVLEPYRNSKFMTGRYKGKRSKRVGSIRILYVVCEECFEKGHMRYNQCVDCKNKPLKKILFYLAMYRKRL